MVAVSPHPYLDAPLPLALAHRGGAGLPANDGIENTLTAFRNAVALGYVFLETDVHVSADGVVYAFHDAHLGRLRALCPDAARSGGPLEIAALKLGPTRWVRRLAARRGVHCVQVPVRRGPITVVTPRFVRRAHETGLQVHVWTVDDPDEMRMLLEIGVDGIVTDRPDVLRDVLDERGSWPDEQH